MTRLEQRSAMHDVPAATRAPALDVVPVLDEQAILRGSVPPRRCLSARFPLPWRITTRFAVIGLASTLAYLAIYLVLRQPLGAVAANALALVATTAANTAANRAFTFGVRGRARALRHQVQGFAVLGVALAVTTSSLDLLHGLDPSPSRFVELAALVTANLFATGIRFIVLRRWVFSGARPRSPASQATHRKRPEWFQWHPRRSLPWRRQGLRYARDGDER